MQVHLERCHGKPYIKLSNLSPVPPLSVNAPPLSAKETVSRASRSPAPDQASAAEGRRRE